MGADIKNIPSEEHLAALVFNTKSVYHEGDERSRTHPGHGYPAYTETIKTIDYIVFSNKEEMEKWVVKTETSKYSKTVYQLIKAQPINAKLTATVEFK